MVGDHMGIRGAVGFFFWIFCALFCTISCDRSTLADGAELRLRYNVIRFPVGAV